MWRPLLIIIFIFAALYGAYYYLNKPEISAINPDPIITAKVPFQSTIIRPFSKPIKSGNLDVSLTPRAHYSISARLLSKRKYASSWESKISQWDFVLGWGNAAKMEFIENLDIKQTVRWYNYKIASNIPMTGQYIATHTSNHHIIPSSENVRRALLFLKKFDVIKLDGYLVDANCKIGDRNFSWISSMNRTDTGGGACEIFLVESIQIGDKVYR